MGESLYMRVVKLQNEKFKVVVMQVSHRWDHKRSVLIGGVYHGRSVVEWEPWGVVEHHGGKYKYTYRDVLTYRYYNASIYIIRWRNSFNNAV